MTIHIAARAEIVLPVATLTATRSAATEHLLLTGVAHQTRTPPERTSRLKGRGQGTLSHSSGYFFIMRAPLGKHDGA
jgi:hypothetical protein